MSDTATGSGKKRSLRYAWYVVGVLTLLNISNFVDRYVLVLMIDPMKRDLGISDTQMSLLMGFSFAVFFSLFGLPIARLADRHSRRTVIAIGCLVWSVMTAACGLARNYGQLLLLRVGVGVGEATLSPAGYSLISDYFPKERLATAMSVYQSAVFLGVGVSFIFGGLAISAVSGEGGIVFPIIGEVRPWQAAFLLVGVSGIPLALLMYTVREPIRRSLQSADAAAGQGGSEKAASIGEVWRYFVQNKGTFTCLLLGYTLLALTSYTTWGPTLFMRNYGWSVAEAGVTYGLLTSILGVAGILAGGRFADYLTERGYQDAGMRIGLIVALAWFPTGILFPLMPSAGWAIAFLIPSYFLVIAPWGAAAAAVQQAVPPTMRAQAAAVYLLVLNLIGMGVAPTAVALVTDYVFRDDNALNYSLLIVGAVSHVIAALLLWKGLGFFRETLNRLRNRETAVDDDGEAYAGAAEVRQ